MPTLYIMAGPNGAGKTTAAKTFLSQVFHTSIFINADEMAKRLNPDNVAAVAFQAGRMMLQQIEKRLMQQATFAIETTLATKTYLKLVEKAQLLNYEVVLFFFYLPSIEMAKQRVALRVSKGGHHIPADGIARRYVLGIRNLFAFIKIVDQWFIYENDHTPPQLVAEGELATLPVIYNFDIWERLKTI